MALLPAVVLSSGNAWAQMGETMPPPSTSSSLLKWAGHEWRVKSSAEVVGPGPNLWDGRNVWLDDRGGLHLKLARREGKWTCAELSSVRRFGFGRYSFKVEGAVDRLDPNIVLGLFLYPTPDVGPDGTHEIDIEFARWGRHDSPIGNYTVWHTRNAHKNSGHTFPIVLDGTFTTYSWTWQPGTVSYQSQHGHHDGASQASGSTFAQWEFKPKDAASEIAQKPMPLHFNLWLFQGRAPTDGQEVEIVIRDFRFEPIESSPKADK